MSQENGRVIKRVLAAAAAFVAVLALSASAGAAPVTPFREVAHMEGENLAVWSDGARFAWATTWPRENSAAYDEVRVFDHAARPQLPAGGLTVLVDPRFFSERFVRLGNSAARRGSGDRLKGANPVAVRTARTTVGAFRLSTASDQSRSVA